jgi:hypothetical protein
MKDGTAISTSWPKPTMTSQHGWITKSFTTERILPC